MRNNKWLRLVKQKPDLKDLKERGKYLQEIKEKKVMGRFRRDGHMKTDGYGHTNMHMGNRVKRREGDGCMEQRER